MKKFATQMKLDIFYNDISEVYAFQNAIEKINENSEFDIEIPPQNTQDTEDMTEFYKANGEVTG